MAKSCIDAILAAEKGAELHIKLKDLAKLKAGKGALRTTYESSDIYFKGSRQSKTLIYETTIVQEDKDTYKVSFRLKK